MRRRMHRNRILRFFSFGHLPPHLQPVSKIFHDAAAKLIAELPEEAHNQDETDMALRKLLEAKDCAVRAMIPM